MTVPWNQGTPLFYDLCRLCLQNTAGTDIFIYDSLREDIFTFIGVKVRPGDNLPQKLCTLCLQSLNSIKYVKTLALENVRHFKSLFGEDLAFFDELLSPMTLCEEKYTQTEPNVNVPVSTPATIEVHSQNKVYEEKYTQTEPNVNVEVSAPGNTDNISRAPPLRINVRKDLVDGTWKIHQATPIMPETFIGKTTDTNTDVWHIPDSLTTEEETQIPDSLTTEDETQIPEIPTIDIEDDDIQISNRSKNEVKFVNKFIFEDDIVVACADTDTKKTKMKSETVDQQSDVKKLKCESKAETIKIEDEYECPKCNKKFFLYKKFYLHQRQHIKKFKCPLSGCGKKFSSKGDLAKHTRVHTGEKPFKCKTCDRRFAQRVTLRQHEDSIHFNITSDR